MSKAEDAAPPHRRWELDQARLAVVGAVRKLVAQGAPLPPMLVDVWHVLERLEAENAEHTEAQRLANLARVRHYTAHPADRKTLCGLKVATTPHGWVGAGNEFYLWAVERGANICPRCREMVET
jgi:hypothetical protein